jgi:hypothetical protein
VRLSVSGALGDLQPAANSKTAPAKKNGTLMMISIIFSQLPTLQQRDELKYSKLVLHGTIHND